MLAGGMSFPNSQQSKHQESTVTNALDRNELHCPVIPAVIYLGGDIPHGGLLIMLHQNPFIKLSLGDGKCSQWPSDLDTGHMETN